METHSITGSKAGIVWFFICIFFLVSCAKAENTTDPTWNQNLTPIEGWRSALYCLQNHSDACPANHTLDESGWLNVTHEQGEVFCKQGCADHTRAVLTCILHVKRDYWFANKATLKDLNETINIGCDTPQGFNGTSIYPSNGYKIDSAYLISALSALVLVALY